MVQAMLDAIQEAENVSETFAQNGILTSRDGQNMLLAHRDTAQLGFPLGEIAPLITEAAIRKFDPRAKIDTNYEDRTHTLTTFLTEYPRFQMPREIAKIEKFLTNGWKKDAAGNWLNAGLQESGLDIKKVFEIALKAHNHFSGEHVELLYKVRSTVMTETELEARRKSASASSSTTAFDDLEGAQLVGVQLSEGQVDVAATVIGFKSPVRQV